MTIVTIDTIDAIGFIDFTLVRPGDRTSMKAGGDACAPGQGNHPLITR
ncbi:MAG: hypothetical protein ACI30J_03555 [Paludibacteraceae bacterium]